MKVKLLRDSRIMAKAGDIVEVSPATADFLLSTGSAVIMAETATKELPEGAEKAVKPPKAATKTATKGKAKK